MEKNKASSFSFIKNVYLLEEFRCAEESLKNKSSKRQDLFLKCPLVHLPHLGHVAVMGSESLKHGRTIPVTLQRNMEG